MKQELDFIVIGAQKSGTTSLFEYMRRHPAIELPASKEVPYFSHDPRYAHPWDEYLRKGFPFADPDCRWGTVTPQYMVGGLYDYATQPDGASLPGDELTVPARIRERLPDVRLIAILRDPVERARSHHAMAILNGWDTRPFDEAVNDLLDPDALLRARGTPEETTGYVVWGEYGRILAGYREMFAPEQFLILFTDELRDDPQSVLRRVFRFLDVDPDFTPDNLGVSYREGGTSQRFKWLNLNLMQEAAASSRLGRRLWHAIPEPTRRRIDVRFNRMNYLVGLWNRRGSTRAEAKAATDVALREHYTSDADQIAELFDVTVPWAPASAPTR